MVAEGKRVMELAQRTCSSQRKNLVKLPEFRVFDCPPLHRVAQFLGDDQNTIAGYAVDDLCAVWNHERAPGALLVITPLQDTHEPACAEFFNLALCLAVQMQRDGEALLLRLLAVLDDGRIVAANLGVAGAARGRPVEIVENEARHRPHAVVCRRRLRVYGQRTRRGRLQCQLGRGSKDYRSEIEDGRRVAGADEFRVATDSQGDAAEEDVFGDCGQADGCA